MLVTEGSCSPCNSCVPDCKETKTGVLGCDTVADFNITRLGTRETGDSFHTSRGEHFATAEGGVEICGSPALVSTSGLFHCTT
jgi:hypothetical protein